MSKFKKQIFYPLTKLSEFSFSNFAMLAGIFQIIASVPQLTPNCAIIKAQAGTDEIISPHGGGGDN